MTPTPSSTGDAEVTEADVAAAERDAADAEALAAALEEQVREGAEDVTAEQIANARSLGIFARLRVEATERKLAKARTAARLAALGTISDEVQAYGDAVGRKLADLLQACHDANEAYRAALKAHNDRVQDFHARAAALGVPDGMGAPRPSAEHGRLAIGATGGVRADMVTVGVLSTKSPTIPDAVDRIANEPDLAAELIEHARERTVSRAAGPEAGLTYYRGTGGAVIGFDKPFTPAEAKNRGLTKLADKEVWG